jgi:probable rRNA maturation factor
VIHYRNAVARSGVDGRALVGVAKQLVAAAGQPDATLSLTLVNDRAIQQLNREHRGADRPTDVLSFPLLDDAAANGARHANGALGQPERMLGDVVISVETARRQAAGYDAPLQAEIYRLLIHGLLHLLGHDHHEAGERRTMRAQERRLAAAIGLPWPYRSGG